ncbi:hypothetical protein CYMTET_7075 [Cymbomonas tetramitiformis]|uniref:Tubulin-tyrosine ligase family protein n=1 Tax=Cymbomonas tetramitiformis TaxID=36881 RepID=A0AAE0GW63_9CHLO|nr:hypothetical protein CYMTET_40895 [Cymbomonas tetramitiformis]KAK3285313.1 hypothetical protein CYMTET_7075 [Cymbomonas tetramitiformis]
MSSHQASTLSTLENNPLQQSLRKSSRGRQANASLSALRRHNSLPSEDALAVPSREKHVAAGSGRAAVVVARAGKDKVWDTVADFSPTDKPTSSEDGRGASSAKTRRAQSTSSIRLESDAMKPGSEERFLNRGGGWNDSVFVDVDISVNRPRREKKSSAALRKLDASPYAQMLGAYMPREKPAVASRVFSDPRVYDYWRRSKDPEHEIEPTPELDPDRPCTRERLEARAAARAASARLLEAQMHTLNDMASQRQNKEQSREDREALAAAQREKLRQRILLMCEGAREQEKVRRQLQRERQQELDDIRRKDEEERQRRLAPKVESKLKEILSKPPSTRPEVGPPLEEATPKFKYPNPSPYDPTANFDLEYSAWKARHKLPLAAKVFAISGCYEDLRKALKARGWYENKDSESVFWDLKWSLRARDIGYRRLAPHQIVNHFENVANCLTTKAGLLNSLRTQLRWFSDQDPWSMFPRCYNLNDPADFAAFVTDFRWCAAESILKRALLDGGIHPKGVNSAEAVGLALEVCQVRLRFLKYLVEEEGDGHGEGLCPELPNLSDKQWCTLLSCSCFRAGLEGIPHPVPGFQPSYLRVEAQGSSPEQADADGREPDGNSAEGMCTPGLGSEVDAVEDKDAGGELHTAADTGSVVPGEGDAAEGAGTRPAAPESEEDAEAGRLVVANLAERSSHGDEVGPATADEAPAGTEAAEMPAVDEAPGKMDVTAMSAVDEREMPASDGDMEANRASSNAEEETGAQGSEGCGSTDGADSPDDHSSEAGEGSGAEDAGKEERDRTKEAAGADAAERAEHPAGAAECPGAAEEDAAALSRAETPAPSIGYGLRSVLAYKPGSAAEQPSSGPQDGLEIEGPTGLDAAAPAARPSISDAPARLPTRVRSTFGQVATEPIEGLVPLSLSMTEEIETALTELKARSPQSASIDGAKNVWVLKPAGKSRGRGIKLYNQLDMIMHYIGEETPEDDHWIIQKYMEHPLILFGRKFDIRQWVLVTNWNPLTVWFYDECYLRFCAEDFTLTDVDNNFQHLSNNSIAKYSDKFDEEGMGEGNMWEVQQFVRYLQRNYGEAEANAIWSKVNADMRSIVKMTMECAQAEVEARRGSCELYGYDFCIDSDFKVWLIEINCSPSLEHSTPVTERLCTSMMEDFVKVMVDLPEERARHRADGDQSDCLDDFDTGGWECMYKNDVYVSKPMNILHSNLVCTGQSIAASASKKKKAKVSQDSVNPYMNTARPNIPVASKKKKKDKSTENHVVDAEEQQCPPAGSRMSVHEICDMDNPLAEHNAMECADTSDFSGKLQEQTLRKILDYTPDKFAKKKNHIPWVRLGRPEVLQSIEIDKMN